MSLDSKNNMWLCKIGGAKSQIWELKMRIIILIITRVKTECLVWLAHTETPLISTCDNQRVHNWKYNREYNNVSTLSYFAEGKYKYNASSFMRTDELWRAATFNWIRGEIPSHVELSKQ